MPDSEVKPDNAEHAGVMAHAKDFHTNDSHDHSAMMATGHMGNVSHSGESSHSGSMPCCDESAICEHGHCSMTFALIGANVQTLAQASLSSFNPFSFDFNSQTYEILLPPPSL